MNILPHKSWHVRNKDNIERVRRDEEKARLEEEKKAKRAALAEQEARTSFLRTRARTGSSKELASNSTSSTGSEIVPLPEEPRHINFFQDIEEGLRQGTNPEYEAEKKAEQEKQEKAIGILTYLGQSASQKHGEHPWYVKKDKQKETKEDVDDVRDSKRKDALDPLNTMKRYLATKEAYHNKQHKKHKKSKRKEEKSPKKKSIEQLRAERLKRENAERTRERELLSLSKGETTATTEPGSDNPYRYNSQFNPDLVRKPRNTGHQRYRPY